MKERGETTKKKKELGGDRHARRPLTPAARRLPTFPSLASIMPPPPPPLLSERATPYAIPAWSKAAILAGADSITPAALGDLAKQQLPVADDRPAGEDWQVAAGPRATAVGSLCAWGGGRPTAGLTPVASPADAPPGVPGPLAAVLTELETGAVEEER